MIEIADDEIVPIKELTELYESVGWLLYASDPDRLALAVDRSTYVATARSDGELVGLARCLSDDVAVLYLQEAVIRPDHQRSGLGTSLITKCLDRFSHVPQKVLLADGDAEQHAFYRSLGFLDIADLERNKLHAFVRSHPELG